MENANFDDQGQVHERVQIVGDREVVGEQMSQETFIVSQQSDGPRIVIEIGFGQL